MNEIPRFTMPENSSITVVKFLRIGFGGKVFMIRVVAEKSYREDDVPMNFVYRYYEEKADLDGRFFWSLINDAGLQNHLLGVAFTNLALSRV